MTHLLFIIVVGNVVTVIDITAVIVVAIIVILVVVVIVFVVVVTVPTLLLLSRYNAPFIVKIKQWVSNIQKTTDIMETWMSVQVRLQRQ